MECPSDMCRLIRGVCYAISLQIEGQQHCLHKLHSKVVATHLDDGL